MTFKHKVDVIGLNTLVDETSKYIQNNNKNNKNITTTVIVIIIKTTTTTMTTKYMLKIHEEHV